VKILDSDHCIALLRGKLDLRERVSALDELAITAISVGELAHGAHKSARAAENLARLDVLLAVLVVGVEQIGGPNKKPPAPKLDADGSLFY
jgi:predicted nucleic acid-binding protein